jgi:hypothetical protein
MRLLTGSLLVAGLSGLLGSAHAEGDALVDSLGPREIAVGEAMRGGATGSTAIGLNPAGLPLNQELVFEGGYGYRGSDSASLVSASACDSTNALPGCFYYEYAGSNPDSTGMSAHRSTHIFGTSLAYPISQALSIGSSGKYYHHNTNVMGEDDTTGFTVDLGANYRAGNTISIGAALYNAFGTDSPDFPRAAGGGVLARPAQMLALSFDARWKLIDGDHSARYGGGAELFLRNDSGQVGFPLRAGLLHDSGLGTTYLSGGVGLAGMRYSFDVAARHAVDGGDETLVIASLRFFGPRMGQGSSDL